MRRETWSTKLGVIMAVSGAAVGIGNFLRFPGRAALYGGGAFMIPYFVSLLILGIPICWVEWTLGRHGGSHGFSSAPGIFSVAWQSPLSRFFGALAVFIPVVIYMYYVVIEAWCLGYTWMYLSGGLQPGNDPTQYAGYFAQRFSAYIGADADGSLLAGLSPAMVAVAVCFALNFYLIYRGLTKGIEAFCNWAVPGLTLAAVVVLIRVLTLGTPDPALPDQNVINGLGFMWNPKPLHGGGSFSALWDPQVWLEAAGQIFFTLGVGFGIIMTYASYLKRDDDVVLSSLTASATNEFSEVCLGGMITIPAAFIFLGALPLERVAGSSIGLGFLAVPVVFQYLPLGWLFGFLWFLMLFIAALASSLAMLQPAIALLEEGFDLGRRASVTLLAFVTGSGTLVVIYFSHNTVALDVMDFWVGSALLLVLALFEVILFGWVIGVERGIAEANRGSALEIGRIFVPIIKWICPAYLLLILVGFAYQNFADKARAIAAEPAAIFTVLFMALILAFFLVCVRLAVNRWEAQGRFVGVREMNR
jgi:SNF family Na+-dependent transporter